MMMDSGAGCNGGRCKKLFKHYKVHPHDDEHPELNCVSACGTKLEHNGYCNLHVEIGGEEHILPMDDLNVDVPILSVRKIVRNGNYVKCRLGGGYIFNKKTGKKLYFVERQGVYFVKVKMLEPMPGDGTSSKHEDASSSVFSRRG